MQHCSCIHNALPNLLRSCLTCDCRSQSPPKVCTAFAAAAVPKQPVQCCHLPHLANARGDGRSRHMLSRFGHLQAWKGSERGSTLRYDKQTGHRSSDDCINRAIAHMLDLARILHCYAMGVAGRPPGLTADPCSTDQQTVSRPISCHNSSAALAPTGGRPQHPAPQPTRLAAAAHLHCICHFLHHIHSNVVTQACVILDQHVAVVHLALSLAGDVDLQHKSSSSTGGGGGG